MTSVDIDKVEQQLWPRGSNRDVWMIVDPARDRRIYWDLTNSHLDYSCLYSGDIPEAVEAVAPHLVQLEHKDSSTRELIKRAWGKSWGVFLTCESSMHRLRRHLRTLLLVNDWRGNRLLFRFYDPRVLRAFIPTCRADELKSLFGPIGRFAMESDTGDRLLIFDFSRGSLVNGAVDVATVQAKEPGVSTSEAHSRPS
jgi:hypothetical protein